MYHSKFSDIADLRRAELFTPEFEASSKFFEIVGLHELGRQGESVFLRAWGDYERMTLQAARGEWREAISVTSRLPLPRGLDGHRVENYHETEKLAHKPNCGLEQVLKAGTHSWSKIFERFTLRQER